MAETVGTRETLRLGRAEKVILEEKDGQLAAWEAFNPRQQAYLQTISVIDQEAGAALVAW
jgi:hypothetical protein